MQAIEGVEVILRALEETCQLRGVDDRLLYRALIGSLAPRLTMITWARFQTSDTHTYLTKLFASTHGS